MSNPAPYHWSAIPLLLVIACAPEDSEPAASFAEGCVLNTATVCEDCLVLEHEFQIGSVAGPGFISGRGGEDQIVRDGSGNYWLGQREHMNVYDPDGEFIRTVGRKGEGPMEFERAYPFHADAGGHVHIWDPHNLRVTIIAPDFALVDEKPLSGRQINDMMAIDDGSLYVMQTWSSDPANPGQPLHIVDGQEVLVSFGAEYGPGDDPSDFNPLDERYAAVAPNGSIMVAHREEYRIEAWSRDGQLLGSLTGPDLENTAFEPGEVTAENPLPNFLTDLHVDASGRVWVSQLVRRPDWVERSEEDPQGGLMPAGMDILNWFRSRIDLVDVETCTLLASHEQDPFFLDFVEDGLIADVEFSPAGAPLVNLKRIGLRGEAGAPDGDTQRMSAVEPVEAPEATAGVGFGETNASGWTVLLDIDEGDLRDTVRYALSPWVEEPEPLGQADGDFRSRIYYTCLDAQERELGGVHVDWPLTVFFGAPPRLAGGEELEPGGLSERLEVSTHWGGEMVEMNVYAVPRGRRIILEHEDAAERETGDSSHAEFLRRLLESGSAGPDVMVIEMDWEDVGPVSYTYSLEGAADAIREAGRPCVLP
ncbi:MAG: hypothetical protein OXF01_13965 [Gemmatimonadetes bacterium]|nr:hypothetical protein [Gemmatimonadota bacterium]